MNHTYTIDMSDVSEERREYNKRYAELHKEELKEKRKERHRKNKEIENKKCALYYKENKENISNRKKKKYYDNINETHKKAKQYRDNNPEITQRMRDSGSKWNKSNRNSINKRLQNNRKERKEWFINIKTDFKCSICGRVCNENNFSAFDFHHRNPTEKDEIVSKIIYVWSQEHILEEIDKCEFVCANCHKIIHETDKISKDIKINKNKTLFKEYMSSKSCEICGETRLACLVWHHTNPEDKWHEVCFMLQRTYSFESVLKEIDKCECLCECCHRIKHHNHL